MTDDRLAELEAACDTAAAAVADFEAEWAATEEAAKTRRKAVNDAYREADAALQAELNARKTATKRAAVEAAEHAFAELAGGDEMDAVTAAIRAARDVYAADASIPHEAVLQYALRAVEDAAGIGTSSTLEPPGHGSATGGGDLG